MKLNFHGYVLVVLNEAAIPKPLCMLQITKTEFFIRLFFVFRFTIAANKIYLFIMTFFRLVQILNAMVPGDKKRHNNYYGA